VSWAYTHTERIRFGDLDAMRHLNNVVFLRYFETARINYLNSMRVGERLLAEGYGVLVGYDYETERSAPLPEALKARLRR
jgi:acyl-CoA thioesterase FadM